METPLRYSAKGGLFGDTCWMGEQDGKLVRVYKRVVAGVAVPRPEQPQGCVVVVGEIYNPKAQPSFKAPVAPPVFTAISARVGAWEDLELGLGEFRRRFMVGEFVSEPEEEAAEELRRVRNLQWASELVSSVVVPAPAHALGERARQRVDALHLQGRLLVGPVQAILEQVSEPAGRALQCLVIYLLEHPATYKAGLRIKSPSYGWSHPGGEPSGPFDREG